MTDAQIERMLARLIDDHLPPKRREEVRAWLKARIDTFKSMERLG